MRIITGRLPSIRLAALAVLLLVGTNRTLAASTIQPGEALRIGAGTTPGIATDVRGTVHLLYMRDGAVFHRQRAAGGEFGPAEPLPLPEVLPESFVILDFPRLETELGGGRKQERTPRTTHHGLVFASGSEPQSALKEGRTG